jgi:hypothetical protein
MQEVFHLRETFLPATELISALKLVKEKKNRREGRSSCKQIKRSTTTI